MFCLLESMYPPPSPPTHTPKECEEDIFCRITVADGVLHADLWLDGILNGTDKSGIDKQGMPSSKANHCKRNDKKHRNGPRR